MLHPAVPLAGVPLRPPSREHCKDRAQTPRVEPPTDETRAPSSTTTTTTATRTRTTSPTRTLVGAAHQVLPLPRSRFGVPVSYVTRPRREIRVRAAPLRGDTRFIGARDSRLRIANRRIRKECFPRFFIGGCGEGALELGKFREPNRRTPDPHIPEKYISRRSVTRWPPGIRGRFSSKRESEKAERKRQRERDCISRSAIGHANFYEGPRARRK